MRVLVESMTINISVFDPGPAEPGYALHLQTM